MKRKYTGLEAIKVSFSDYSLTTGNSQCWQWVANVVGVQHNCATEESGKIDTWEDM